jgi:hypothetical protein
MDYPGNYMALYNASAMAVKSVHPSLRIGGPATMQVGVAVLFDSFRIFNSLKKIIIYSILYLKETSFLFQYRTIIVFILIL